ncbi:hypothetical protein M3Y95_00202200 [Aphelenchoides besseyi]|nr:hypothetical protein M3Y95_00202200 [Aphelenchoides besseyi]
MFDERDFPSTSRFNNNNNDVDQSKSTPPNSETIENLESLLSDLQKTTEVLRRKGRKSAEDDKWDSTTTSTHYSFHGGKGGYADDEDPYRNYASNRSSMPDYGSRYSSHSEIRSTGREGSQFDSALSSGIPADYQTIPRGDCQACGKEIVGQVVIALGQMWHPSCFTCCHCGDEIGHRNFFERSGKAYCEADYHDLFSPRCAYCNGAIKDRCINALGKTYHKDHFLCNECGRPFGDEGFHEKNGVPLCKDDFFRLYAPNCHGCSQPITSKYITALETHWHPECFTCKVCGISGVYFDEENKVLLCEIHHHEYRGSLCLRCNRPISGRCVSAMGGKFHTQCLCCSYCNRQLCSGTFKELRGRPYCHSCYSRIQ